MSGIGNEKELLRKQIAALKKDYSAGELDELSSAIFASVENLPVFQSSEDIFIYNSLKSEVQTSEFIAKWNGSKNFYLPVVGSNGLIFRKYKPETEFRSAALGVMEPDGDDFTDYASVGMVIVPGVAFDKELNRLGRGKGYYDRFLKHLTVTKVGVCFGFQLFDNIPAGINDVKMDCIISDKEIICKNS